uniref:TIR domain-containing protein n=1 Tax=Nymphaea colorata TaxID=210225 RepID=A0A5K0ZE43_9MAGN
MKTNQISPILTVGRQKTLGGGLTIQLDAMEGATKEMGVCSHSCGVNGTEASSQTSQGDDVPKYDFFLSFKSTDTRKGFIAHLYDALVMKGTSTFTDNVNLEKGERVNNLSGYIESLYI